MAPNEWLTAIWGRIRAMGATAGLIGTAILLAWAGAKAVKRKSSADKHKSKAIDLMNSEIKSEQKKAQIHFNKADKKLKEAAQAKEQMHAELEKIANASTDADDIIDAFRSRRLRRPG